MVRPGEYKCPECGWDSSQQGWIIGNPMASMGDALRAEKKGACPGCGNTSLVQHPGTSGPGG